MAQQTNKQTNTISMYQRRQRWKWWEPLAASFPREAGIGGDDHAGPPLVWLPVSSLLLLLLPLLCCSPAPLRVIAYFWRRLEFGRISLQRFELRPLLGKTLPHCILWRINDWYSWLWAGGGGGGDSNNYDLDDLAPLIMLTDRMGIWKDQVWPSQWCFPLNRTWRLWSRFLAR